MRAFVKALAFIIPSGLLIWSVSAQPALRLAAAPKIIVMPYVQPGSGPALGGIESKRLHWFTDQAPGDFTVEYQASSSVWRTAVPTRIALDFECAAQTILFRLRPHFLASDCGLCVVQLLIE